MLSSFEDRLTKLEGSILPIHNSTKNLTKLHENIEKSLQHVDTIVDYMSLASQEEPYITKGYENKIQSFCIQFPQHYFILIHDLC